jgi:hypothetical protein
MKNSYGRALVAGACLAMSTMMMTTTARAQAERTPEERAHLERMDSLERELREEELRGRLDETRRRNQRAAAQKEAESPSAVLPLEKRSFVLPHLLGFEASSQGLGIVAGPLRFEKSTGSGLTFQSFVFAPSADVVLGGRWTVGGALVVGQTDFGQGERLSFGVAPRVGALIPLGRGVTLWPQFSASVGRGRIESALGPISQNGLQSLTTTQETNFGAVARATIVFPVSSYVFFGFGASVGMSLAWVEDGDRSESIRLGTDARLGLAF